MRQSPRVWHKIVLNVPAIFNIMTSSERGMFLQARMDTEDTPICKHRMRQHQTLMVTPAGVSKERWMFPSSLASPVLWNQSFLLEIGTASPKVIYNLES